MMRRSNSMTAAPLLGIIIRLATGLLFLWLAGRLAEAKTIAKGHPGKASVAEPGADIFDANAPVLRFNIEMAPSDLEVLRKDARKYVLATVREGDLIFTNVAVHLKGAAGSFRQIDDKPALTLSFEKFVPGRRFH